MPTKMNPDDVWANVLKSRKELQAYRAEHAVAIAKIMDALRPLTSYKKALINCPCGTNDVVYNKLPQHISSKKHRAVMGEIPTLEGWTVVIKPTEKQYSGVLSVASSSAPQDHLATSTNPSV